MQKKPAGLELFMPDSVEFFGLFLFVTWNCSRQLQVSFCAKETWTSRIVHAWFWGIIRAVIVLVIVHDLELFMTTPCLFCVKETCNSRKDHTRFCGIIRAVIVHDLELYMTTPSLFLYERDQQLSNCSWLGIVHDKSRSLFVRKRPAALELCIPNSFLNLWNYSGCCCSWIGLFCAKETCNSQTVHVPYVRKRPAVTCSSRITPRALLILKVHNSMVQICSVTRFWYKLIVCCIPPYRVLLVMSPLEFETSTKIETGKIRQPGCRRTRNLASGVWWSCMMRNSLRAVTFQPGGGRLLTCPRVQWGLFAVGGPAHRGRLGPSACSTRTGSFVRASSGSPTLCLWPFALWQG